MNMEMSRERKKGVGGYGGKKTVNCNHKTNMNKEMMWN